MKASSKTGNMHWERVASCNCIMIHWLYVGVYSTLANTAFALDIESRSIDCTISHSRVESTKLCGSKLGLNISKQRQHNFNGNDGNVWMNVFLPRSFVVTSCTLIKLIYSLHGKYHELRVSNGKNCNFVSSSLCRRLSYGWVKFSANRKLLVSINQLPFKSW